MVAAVAMWALADPGLSAAAELPGSPTELDRDMDGNPSISIGPCWGYVHNPHNSSSENPGPDHVQAKTNMRCDDTLDQLDGELTVTQSLYVWDTGISGWSLMSANVSTCPGADYTTGWTQCRPYNYGAHDLMIAGVNALCAKGSTEHYLQSSSALLVLGNGNAYGGTASKAAYNVYCKGK